MVAKSPYWPTLPNGQAEQLRGPGIELDQAGQVVDCQVRERDRAEQQPSKERGMGQAEQLESQRKDQAEQMPSLRMCEVVADQAEHQLSPETVPGCAQAEPGDRDRAELHSSSSQINPQIKRCHTRKWPVARLGDCPVLDLHKSSLISVNSTGKTEAGLDAAYRAEHCANLSGKSGLGRAEKCQYRPGIDSTIRCEDKPQDIISSGPQDIISSGPSSGDQSEQLCTAKTLVRAKQLDPKKSQARQDSSSRRVETSTRMERPEGMENEDERQVRLVKAWRDMMKLKKILSGKTTNWQEILAREGWKIKAEGRKLRAETIQRKKQKYGKIIRKGLTEKEEQLIMKFVEAKTELKEVEQNLEMFRETMKKDGK